MEQEFGGAWTVIKLDVFRKYLNAWLSIFLNNAGAKSLRRIYCDGFAGSGYVRVRRPKSMQSKQEPLEDLAEGVLFVDEGTEQGAEVLRGSASIALEASPGFHEYVLIESNPRNRAGLELLRENHSDPASVRILGGDCNSRIDKWIDATDWRSSRALVFLDPFAMQVSWRTLEKIASTKGVDLWLLFPVMAVQRLLQRDKAPNEAHARIIDNLLGDPGWREAFYRPKGQDSLFGDVNDDVFKSVRTEQIRDYFAERLKTIFAGVASQPLLLTNSRGAPMFLLFFAAANEKGAKTAIKIANDIVLKSIMVDGYAR